MPRQLRQAVDAPSAPTSQAVDAPSAPTSQAVDAPSAGLLHGYGAESAPTNTSIEPDAASAKTSRAVAAPSAGSLHDYAQSANRLAAAANRLAAAASGSTNTRFEPPAASEPSVELLHGCGAEAAPTPAASSEEKDDVCSICNERRRWSGGQTVVLFCGHAYCMSCWHGFLEGQPRTAIPRCPACRQEVKLVIPVYG